MTLVLRDAGLVAAGDELLVAAVALLVLAFRRVQDLHMKQNISPYSASLKRGVYMYLNFRQRCGTCVLGTVLFYRTFNYF